MFFLFSGDLEHSLSCFNFYESFGAFFLLGIVRYSKTSLMITHPMIFEKILQKEKYYFIKASLSAGAARNPGFPGPVLRESAQSLFVVWELQKLMPVKSVIWLPQDHELFTCVVTTLRGINTGVGGLKFPILTKRKRVGVGWDSG